MKEPLRDTEEHSTAGRTLRVLIVEDNPDDADLLVFRLEQEGFRLDWTRVDSAQGFCDRLDGSSPPDIVLSDWSIPGFGGTQALTLLNQRALEIPFIVVSGKIGEEAVVDILRRGAYDYVSKDNLVRAGQAVKNALAAATRKDAAHRAETAIRKSRSAFAEINACLVNLGQDYHENVNTLTELCGKLLGATCALYNRLEGGMLCPIGQWNVPAGYTFAGNPEGHPCNDAIRQGLRQVILVKNLPETSYCRSDPNVQRFGLRTCASHVVHSGNDPVGSLCVVYQHDIDLDSQDQGVLSIIASAISNEEQRFLSNRIITENNQKYRNLSTLMRLLADNIPDMLWAKNLNKEYIFANKTICDRLLNAAGTDEPLGKNDLYFAQRERETHPENPEWHTFGEICRDSDSITLEAMRPRQFDEFGNVKGSFLYLDVHKAPLFDDEGKVIGVVGSARDVTAAKEAEKQLRKLSQAVEQSSSSVIITNLEGTIEYANSTFTKITGYTAKEATGRNPRILKSGEQSAEVYQELWTTLASGKSWEGVLHNRKKNGKLFWEYARISPIKNEAGTTTHYLAIKDDITAVKIQQEALIASEAKYRAFMEATQDVVFLKTSEGRFVMINKAAEKHYGKSGKDIIGKGVEDIMPTDVARVCRESDLKALAGNGIVTALEHYRGRVYETKKFTIIFGSEVMIGGYIRDVTEAHLAERELEIEVKVGAIIREQQTRSGILEGTLALLRTFHGTIDARFEVAHDESVLQTDGPVSDQCTNGEVTVRLPLSVQGRFIGMFILKKTAEPDAEDLDLFLLVCRLVANAINVVDLRTETRDRLDKLNALALIDESISSDTDLETTLRVVLDQTVALLKADAAAIFLVDEQQTSLKLAVATGFKKVRLAGETIPLGQPYIGQAAAEQKTILVTDFSGLDPEDRFLQIVREEGFSSYLCAPMVVKSKLLGAIGIYPRGEFHSDAHLVPFFESVARQAAIAIENKTLYRNEQKAKEDLVAAYDATIEGWSRAMDLRDKETEGHSRRVTELALELARRLGMQGEDLLNVRRGALLHDIGKVAIPDGVLLKPGPLSDEEWVIMKKHPSFAHEMLSPIEYLRPSLDIPYCHHEKWDGTGYPRGLSGKDIPLPARIFAVVDVWDALTSDRPYRKAWTSEHARSYIANEAGRHFDPEVTFEFVKMMYPAQET